MKELIGIRANPVGDVTELIFLASEPKYSLSNDTGLVMELNVSDFRLFMTVSAMKQLSVSIFKAAEELEAKQKIKQTEL